MSTHQVFISSYAKDFPWLRVCLYSLKRNSIGFLPPVVCVDGQDIRGVEQIRNQVFPEARIVVKDGRRGQGMARAMLAMMDCHRLSTDKADFYYLVGSDCMAFRKFTPEMHFFRGKPALLWNYYAELSNDGGVSAWQAGTERIMGLPAPKEFMRRLPIIYPKELFAPFRAYVEELHKVPFEDLIYKLRENGCAVSESNLMGVYADKFMPEIYSWLHAANNPDYLEFRTPESDSLIQWWSHGGMDRPAETCVNYAPGKNTSKQTPRAVIREILGHDIA
jgi:hypothetical protein